MSFVTLNCRNRQNPQEKKDFFPRTSPPWSQASPRSEPGATDHGTSTNMMNLCPKILFSSPDPSNLGRPDFQHPWAQAFFSHGSPALCTTPSQCQRAHRDPDHPLKQYQVPIILVPGSRHAIHAGCAKSQDWSVSFSIFVARFWMAGFFKDNWGCVNYKTPQAWLRPGQVSSWDHVNAKTRCYKSRWKGHEQPCSPSFGAPHKTTQLRCRKWIEMKSVVITTKCSAQSTTSLLVGFFVSLRSLVED